MKVKAQAYQPPDGNPMPRLPAVLENLRELFLPDTIKRMRIFGISKIVIKPITVGIRAVNDVTCKTMPETVPAPILALQKVVARQEAEFMLSFGITELELLPTEEEMLQSRQLWENLQKVRPVVMQDAEAPVLGEGPKAVPLNIEPDPSGRSVLGAEKTDNPQGVTQQAGDTPGAPAGIPSA